MYHDFHTHHPVRVTGHHSPGTLDSLIFFPKWFSVYCDAFFHVPRSKILVFPLLPLFFLYQPVSKTFILSWEYFSPLFLSLHWSSVGIILILDYCVTDCFSCSSIASWWSTQIFFEYNSGQGIFNCLLFYLEKCRILVKLPRCYTVPPVLHSFYLLLLSPISFLSLDPTVLSTLTCCILLTHDFWHGAFLAASMQGIHAHSFSPDFPWFLLVSIHLIWNTLSSIPIIPRGCALSPSKCAKTTDSIKPLHIYLW